MKRSKAERLIKEYIHTPGSPSSGSFLRYEVGKPDLEEKALKEILDRLQAVGIIKPDASSDD